MVDLTDRLSACGHRVTLLTTEPDVPDFFELPVAVTRRTLPSGTRTSCRWFDWSCQRRRIAAWREAILREKPALVISFLDTTNVAALLALSGSGIPVVVSERTDPRRHKIGWRWSILRRFLYPRAKAVVMQTEATASWALRQWPRWRVRVIPNAIECGTRGAAGVRPECFGARNLVAMGRLGYEKGFDLLIGAFALVAERFPEWHLTIFGEGTERRSLQDAVAELRLDHRIHLPGIVRNPDRVLPSADLFILSSRYEGFPRVLVEAMAAGLPVIACACPSGPSEIVRDGIDGLLVPPEEVEALAGAMARLMSDETERRRLGQRAMEVSERFSPARINGLWQRLIDEATAATRP